MMKNSKIQMLAKSIVLSIMLICTALLFAKAQKTFLETIRQDYDQVSKKIEEIKKAYEDAENSYGLLANQLKVNAFNGSWRATGNHQKLITFWYVDAPEFANAYTKDEGQEPDPAVVLKRICIDAKISAYQYYKEYHLIEGALVFYYEKNEMDGINKRVYFHQNEVIRFNQDSENQDDISKLTKIQITQANTYQVELDKLIKLFLATFEVE